MSYASIATWKMSYNGVCSAMGMLKDGSGCGDALETLIRNVEDNPNYRSVGYGGLPNAEGIVEMDAAYMCGDTFKVGAIAGIVDVKNPITVARRLSNEKFNSFLVGEGATRFASQKGYERKIMLTDEAYQIWSRRWSDLNKGNINPYEGHDTIGAITLDSKGSMSVGTSSTGLFMKRPGRVGDSPVAGSGFYCDSKVGGAAATGLGEDLMKGCLSYEIVQQMKKGLTPQQACDTSVYNFHDELKERYGSVGQFSLVALNNKGEWGVATNVQFTFVAATNKDKPQIYIAKMGSEHTTIIEKLADKRSIEQDKKTQV